MANWDALVPRRNNCGGKLDRVLKRIRHKFKPNKNQKPKTKIWPYCFLNLLDTFPNFSSNLNIKFFPSLSSPYYALKKMCATLCNSVKPNHVERNLVTTFILQAPPNLPFCFGGFSSHEDILYFTTRCDLFREQIWVIIEFRSSQLRPSQMGNQ